MSDALEQVLRLVAEGRLTAAQAAPIIDALGATDDPDGDGMPGHADPDGDDARAPGSSSGPAGATSIRIEVSEGGRRIVNLRIPVALGRMALDRVPGISGANADLVRRALAEGRTGTLLHIDDEGGGVRIALE